MRGLVALYTIACQEEGTTSNSKLLQIFRKIDMVEEDAAEDAVNSERARAYMRDAFPTTLVIGSFANYLGDEGTAAIFRMLPFMRWVRRVEAKAVGAGQKTIDALCEILAMTEEVPVPVDNNAPSAGSSSGSGSGGGKRPRTIVLPTVPLEYIDLTGNALYAISAKRLLAVARARQVTAMKAKAILSAFPGASSRVRVPPPPEILLDFDVVPPTTARGLQQLNEKASTALIDREARKRELAEARKRKLFCVAEDAANAYGARPKPTGENVVYRIPEVFPALPLPRRRLCAAASTSTGAAADEKEEEEEEEEEEENEAYARYVEPSRIVPFYDTKNPSAVALARAVNAHMEEYMTAHRYCTARDHLRKVEQGDAADAAVFLPGSWEETAAAACPSSSLVPMQLVIDLGVDILGYIKDTHAPLWFTLDLERQTDVSAGDGASSNVDSTARDREELLLRVGRLLRGFLHNPFLEEELLQCSGEHVLAEHVNRMKELYYAITAATEPRAHNRYRWLNQLPYNDVRELKGLYARVVSALVTIPFGKSRMPSLAAAEDRVRTIRAFLIDFMLHAKLVPAAVLAVGSAGASPQAAEAKGSLRLVCSTLKYFKFNNLAACDRWNRHYTAPGPTCARLRKEEEDRERERRALHGSDDVTSEAALLEQAVGTFLLPFSTCTCPEAAATPGGRVPCAACSHSALSDTHTFLTDPYALEREAVLAPLRTHLPVEVRRFLADLALQPPVTKIGSADCGTGSYGGGGCFFPAFFGLPSSLQTFMDAQERALRGEDGATASAAAPHARCPAPPFVSVVDFFAYMDGNETRVKEFCDAFAEWYRLKAIEEYDSRHA